MSLCFFSVNAPICVTSYIATSEDAKTTTVYMVSVARQNTKNVRTIISGNATGHHFLALRKLCHIVATIVAFTQFCIYVYSLYRKVNLSLCDMKTVYIHTCYIKIHYMKSGQNSFIHFSINFILCSCFK